MDTCCNQELAASVKMEGGKFASTKDAYDAAHGKYVVQPPAVSSTPETSVQKMPFSLKG